MTKSKYVIFEVPDSVTEERQGRQHSEQHQRAGGASDVQQDGQRARRQRQPDRHHSALRKPNELSARPQPPDGVL